MPPVDLGQGQGEGGSRAEMVVWETVVGKQRSLSRPVTTNLAQVGQYITFIRCTVCVKSRDLSL